MYSCLQRANTLSSLFSSVILGLCALIAASSWLFSADPSASVQVQAINVYHARTHYHHTAQEFMRVNFDLEADLTSLFNWNTKQLFIYVVASYPGSKYHANDVVIWDKIIKSKQRAKFSAPNLKEKYKVADIAGSWANRNATFSLQWNVMPQTGLLVWGSSQGTTPILLPRPKQK
ncbi:Microsomal signal peptidase subunit 3 [Neolecta irregularis DAH-3]|uniref:Signal peptidase subunit 3 n=1 Tax=Neolecta irregularis (strain DAH-3) TaxID=1198029 RepID=A0A1U7LRY4_NEOID|nr:Microsomal signal peptidase subunit 3 [Neolecta irregularis DAH-3]|eukprot:OLL25404.1 Microsomal signal peptidase subunit 3 [Neolecta irregularis DAH-3]